MNMPEFTAQASLYRTSGRYRSSGLGGGDASAGEAIFPAYYPGADTQARCNNCMTICVERYEGALAAGAVGCAAGCIATGPLYPACYATCMGGVLASADAWLLGCEFLSCAAPRSELFGWHPLGTSPCCPKVCGFLNPFVPGEGCCDEDEHCVDRFDPNARQGCCPSDQSVCGGKCCAKGETCCGNECCPPGWFCNIDGSCTESPLGSFGASEPPPKPPKPSPGSGLFDCFPGWTHCKDKCCPPGLHCCIKAGGATTCQADCLMLK
jgi:hypothetical protein